MGWPVRRMHQVHIVAIADQCSVRDCFIQNRFVGLVGLRHLSPLRAGNAPESDVAIHRRFFLRFILCERGGGESCEQRKRAHSGKDPVKLLHACSPQKYTPTARVPALCQSCFRCTWRERNVSWQGSKSQRRWEDGQWLGFNFVSKLRGPTENSIQPGSGRARVPLVPLYRRKAKALQSPEGKPSLLGKTG